MALWNRGAKRKVMPTSARHASALSGLSSIATPSACRRSALPQRLDMARLPCLATGTPAPATTNAAVVEILNVWEPSPPVPHVSIILGYGARMWCRFLSHDTGAASDLFDGFALDAQSDEKGADLCRGGIALHDLPHGLRGFLLASSSAAQSICRSPPRSCPSSLMSVWLKGVCRSAQTFERVAVHSIPCLRQFDGPHQGPGLVQRLFIFQLWDRIRHHATTGL